MLQYWKKFVWHICCCEVLHFHLTVALSIQMTLGFWQHLINLCHVQRLTGWTYFCNVFAVCLYQLLGIFDLFFTMALDTELPCPSRCIWQTKEPPSQWFLSPYSNSKVKLLRQCVLLIGGMKRNWTTEKANWHNKGHFILPMVFALLYSILCHWLVGWHFNLYEIESNLNIVKLQLKQAFEIQNEKYAQK